MRYDNNHSFGLCNSKKVTSHAVVGEPTCFYIFIATERFNPVIWHNDLNLYHELKQIHKKSTAEFILKCASIQTHPERYKMRLYPTVQHCN